MFSHRITVLQVTWRHHDHRARSRGVNRMDGSPRDRNHNTCVNLNLSEMDLPLIWRHVDRSEVLNLHRTTMEGTTQSLASSSDHDRHRTVVINRDQDTSEETRDAVRLTLMRRSPSDGGRSMREKRSSQPWSSLIMQSRSSA